MAMRAVAEAWRTTGKRVIPLAPSTATGRSRRGSERGAWPTPPRTMSSMGIRKWFNRSDSAPGPEPALAMSVTASEVGEPVKMTGTTTVSAAGAGALFHGRGMYTGGLLELPGQLVPEPENPVDSSAVAVHVEGDKVGHLPGYLADQLALARGEVLNCQVQLWGAVDRGKLRVIGWVAHGAGPAAWPHTEQNPPAVAVADQRVERAAATTQMVDEALGGTDSNRAAQFRRGMVGRYHYLETIESIQQLKREGRLAEALDLCYGAIEAAEQDRGGREPAPWYTEQAAIIHRKRGERDQEVAVLQRWLECAHRSAAPAQRSASGWPSSSPSRPRIRATGPGSGSTPTPRRPR